MSPEALLVVAALTTVIAEQPRTEAVGVTATSLQDARSSADFEGESPGFNFPFSEDALPVTSSPLLYEHSTSSKLTTSFLEGSTQPETSPNVSDSKVTETTTLGVRDYDAATVGTVSTNSKLVKNVTSPLRADVTQAQVKYTPDNDKEQTSTSQTSFMYSQASSDVHKQNGSESVPISNPESQETTVVTGRQEVILENGNAQPTVTESLTKQKSVTPPQVKKNKKHKISKFDFSQAVLPPPNYPDFHDIEYDPNNPYSHWDRDSEEQEREMELQRLQDESDELEYNTTLTNLTDNLTDDIISGDGTPASASGRSYLILLTGNSTIVKLRQKDFAKYLKLNLAARLSVEYDDVKVNRVVLAPPRLLVNVSVLSTSDTLPQRAEVENSVPEEVIKEEAPLHMLAETNATLLELSGEEYHVVRLLPLKSRPINRGTQNTGEDADDLDEDLDDGPTSTLISDRHNDIEAVIYTVVGGACALVIITTLLMTLVRFARSAVVLLPWNRPKPIPSWNLRHHRMKDDFPTVPPPPVIYSGSFAARATSWVDDYHSQSNVNLPEDTVPSHMFGVKVSPYAELEMGHRQLFGDLEASRASPSTKLHIFSCRPGSLLIPITPHSPRRAPKPAAEEHPLDVRIGHDNPNYQT